MVCSSSLDESLLSRVHFLPDHLKYNVDVSHVLLTHYYRPQTKFGQGNIFTGVCLSPLDRHPRADTPPRADPFQEMEKETIHIISFHQIGKKQAPKSIH